MLGLQSPLSACFHRPLRFARDSVPHLAASAQARFRYRQILGRTCRRSAFTRRRWLLDPARPPVSRMCPGDHPHQSPQPRNSGPRTPADLYASQISIQLDSRENAESLHFCEAALPLVESEEDVGLQDQGRSDLQDIEGSRPKS